MRIVQYLDRDSRQTLAAFELVGNEVTATYSDDVYRDELERDGIYTPASGIVRPSDGAAFFAALKVAYGSSSRIAVVDSDTRTA